MTSFDDILSKAALPERAVTLCLREDLVAEYERLDEQLRTASRTAASLAEPAQATTIARRMDELRTEMLDSSVTFQLRAWPATRFARLRDQLDSMKKGKDETDEAFADRWHIAVCDLVSKMLVEPSATPEQIATLADRLSAAQWRDLSDAAWNINAKGQPIPFSAAASGILANAEKK